MNVDFARLRQTMADSQLKPVGVTSPAVLSAFLSVPRELFVPLRQRAAAYADSSVSFKSDKSDGGKASSRSMMPPASLSRLIQAARISKDDFILDIGCATGYGAALLAQLGGAVVALECNAELLGEAEKLFAAQSCENISAVQGDLPQGCAAQAPYDVILLEGSVDFVPEALFSQLREGGRLLAAEGFGNAARAYLYHCEKGIISKQFCFNLALDPLPGFARKKAFVF